jgi:glycosyltransferase involved in cell wall biosynthesis
VLNLITRLSQAGGIPRVVHEIVARSDASRIEHHVCQIRPLDSAKLHGRLLGKAFAHSLELEEGAPLGRSVGYALGNVRFARVVGQVRPDVVHLHTGTSLLAPLARLTTGRKSAWMLDFHEPLEVRHSEKTTRTVYGMARRGGFVGVTHSSQVTLKLEAALGGGVPLVGIPLGVDTAQFRKPAEDRTSWRTRHGWDLENPLVVSVGRIAAMKGAPELLEVARRVLERQPSVQFALIGKGQLLEELSERARALGIDERVRFMGYVDDVTSALAASDVYLSTSRYEGFGIAVLEAMATGLPVVGTKIDGLLDLVVDGETGVLVALDDIQGYADGVCVLTEDAGKRVSMGTAARRRAEQEFDVSVTVRRYESLYLELSARRRSVSPR